MMTTTSSTYLNADDEEMPLTATDGAIYWAQGGDTVMEGSGGNDTFNLYNVDDALIETPGAMATVDAIIGDSTLKDSYGLYDGKGGNNYYLPVNVQNLFPTGWVFNLFGNNLDNLIVAKNQHDETIDGKGGADVFDISGSPDDTIVMNHNYGDAVVYGFNPATDFIRLPSYENILQDGPDAVITIDPSTSLILRNTCAANLTASNFEFPAAPPAAKITFDDEFDDFISSPQGDKGWMTSYVGGGRNLPTNSEAEFLFGQLGWRQSLQRQQRRAHHHRRAGSRRQRAPRLRRHLHLGSHHHLRRLLAALRLLRDARANAGRRRHVAGVLAAARKRHLAARNRRA